MYIYVSKNLPLYLINQSQLKEEAERQQSHKSHDQRWLGLDPAVVHQKYPGIEFYSNYQMRPFIDLSDDTALGMENKPQDIQDMTDAEAEERFYQYDVLTLFYLKFGSLP